MADGPGVYIYDDVAGQWRWSLVAANNEKVAQGEGYVSRSNARRGVDRILEIARDPRLHYHENQAPPG